MVSLCVHREINALGIDINSLESTALGRPFWRHCVQKSLTKAVEELRENTETTRTRKKVKP